ncbi:hypothetical protein I4U23_031135 [Adineta vaga]|nr:hypothetical protein I4U23_031135 [Adineta vaga]
MSTESSSSMIFRMYSMDDYEQHTTEIINLFQRCSTTNHNSVMMGDNSLLPTTFHCEFTDYFRCMKQYPESYCYTMMSAIDGRVVAVIVFNVKLAYFGSTLMTALFSRLIRVEPTLRRQNLAMTMFMRIYNGRKDRIRDYIQGYTTITNNASLNMQQRWFGSMPDTAARLNNYILSTATDLSMKKLRKLSIAETERLWMIDIADWVQRPELSDLRRILNMDEYVGTFIVGDFTAQRYIAVMIWEPSSMIISDDRPGIENAHRGQFRLALNFVESSKSSLPISIDEKEEFIATLCNVTYNDKIPFLICQIQESSNFTTLIQHRALAMTTEIMSRKSLSERFSEVMDQFANSFVWLDPRDCAGLLYFKSMTEKLQSQL